MYNYRYRCLVNETIIIYSLYNALQIDYHCMKVRDPNDFILLLFRKIVKWLQFAIEKCMSVGYSPFSSTTLTAVDLSLIFLNIVYQLLNPIFWGSLKKTQAEFWKYKIMIKCGIRCNFEYCLELENSRLEECSVSWNQKIAVCRWCSECNWNWNQEMQTMQRNFLSKHIITPYANFKSMKIISHLPSFPFAHFTISYSLIYSHKRNLKKCSWILYWHSHQCGIYM